MPHRARRTPAARGAALAAALPRSHTARQRAATVPAPPAAAAAAPAHVRFGGRAGSRGKGGWGVGGVRGRAAAMPGAKDKAAGASWALAGPVHPKKAAAAAEAARIEKEKKAKAKADEAVAKKGAWRCASARTLGADAGGGAARQRVGAAVAARSRCGPGGCGGKEGLASIPGLARGCADALQCWAPAWPARRQRRRLAQTACVLRTCAPRPCRG